MCRLRKGPPPFTFGFSSPISAVYLFDLGAFVFLKAGITLPLSGFQRSIIVFREHSVNPVPALVVPSSSVPFEVKHAYLLLSLWELIHEILVF